jgi:hypothetical protein
MIGSADKAAAMTGDVMTEPEDVSVEAAKKAEQFWSMTGVVEAIRALKDKQPVIRALEPPK